MKAEELFIGAHVEALGKNRKIKSIVTKDTDVEVSFYGNNPVVVSLDMLRPIPLTSEILEKNGWISDNSNDPLRIYNLHHGNKLCSIIAIADDGKWSIEVSTEIARKDKRGRADLVTFARDWCNGFCVHELQHALNLCGSDKEIVI